MIVKTGWLAIPASLLLLFGCQTSIEESTQVAAPAKEEILSHEILTPDADVWVLTFFDLYCVACQQSADNFAKLNTMLSEQPMDETVRVLGIGTGDTAFEVEVFLKRYPLGYRCIPDPDTALKYPFSLRGTPTVLVLKPSGNGWREVYRHEGRFRSDDLNMVLESVR
ncbi:hypothetical protein G0Q06_04935 [Puniceicoccales bacterium CK1056]|uniref:Thioredoxin domain-containing protein n=1 Tax=Oceanipulchritudo coccoides TaxID=2706888 RepID=A0A6B2M0F0_9BACT|nr:hypothetical protein [Oceanipulchritudo coccoides]NDV61789.1 hypothetical protein [Oceanipulchritudo coccoides]